SRSSGANDVRARSRAHRRHARQAGVHSRIPNPSLSGGDGEAGGANPLRDASATVEVIPLIAASIMSKKISESLTGLVLDVKRGSGSFLPKLDDELKLAQAMIDLGARHACPVVALLTAMDRPLGEACGNALEVVE